MESVTELISSRSNKEVKYLKSLELARNRQREGRFLVEGVRLVEDAVRENRTVEKLIVTPRADDDYRAAHVIAAARERGVEVLLVADRVLDYISDTKTTQGVMALVKSRQYTEDDLAGGQMPLIVVAHLLQDPGNLGTIVRVAEAAGAGGVVITPGTVDLYNPKALRATMGSIFRLPTVRAESLEGFVKRFRKKGYQVVAAMVSGRKRYFDVDYMKPTVLIIGQEASGLPSAASGLANVQVSIPMATMIDSLNVASAASVILYEAVRQRLVLAETARDQ